MISDKELVNLMDSYSNIFDINVGEISQISKYTSPATSKVTSNAAGEDNQTNTAVEDDQSKQTQITTNRKIQDEEFSYLMPYADIKGDIMNRIGFYDNVIHFKMRFWTSIFFRPRLTLKYHLEGRVS